MKTFSKILKLLKSKKYLIFTALALAFVSVILSLYVNVVIGEAVDFMSGAGNVNFDGMKRCVVIIAVSVAISCLFNYFMNVLLSKTAFFAVKILRQKLFDKLQKIHVKHIDERAPGDMISRLINDIEQVSDGLILSFAHLFTGLVTICGTLFFMFYLNWKIAIIVVVATPLTLLVSRFIANNTYKYFVQQTSVNGELSQFTEESVSSVSVVKAFDREDNNFAKFREINDRLVDSSIKAVFFSSTTQPTTRLINGLIYAILGVVGAFTVMNNPDGTFTIGLLSSFLAYANQFSKPFNEISGVLAEFQGALAGAERVFEIIEIPDETEKENAAESFTCGGKIDISDVSFSYDENTELIKDFNVRVNNGERVAIVGPTGCGKTTFINLLMRFYDVDKGSVSMDNVDIRDIKRDALRENYGMVLQETWLRNATVRENIAMARPDASQGEIEEAAKSAHAHNFILQLEKGYDTVISNEGARLSYGQKQLICIARLMLCKPPMLILDEATSSIDTRTEIKVQNAFAELMKGRTSFIVAHRLSTIKNCDMIIVMKNGKILEQGTHTELIQRNGFYRELYESQVN